MYPNEAALKPDYMSWRQFYLNEVKHKDLLKREFDYDYSGKRPNDVTAAEKYTQKTLYLHPGTSYGNDMGYVDSEAKEVRTLPSRYSEEKEATQRINADRRPNLHPALPSRDSKAFFAARRINGVIGFGICSLYSEVRDRSYQNVLRIYKQY